MVLSAKGRYIYIPRFNNNRELVESAQVTVEIIRARVEERGQLFAIDTSRDLDAVDVEKPRSGARAFLRTSYKTGRILRDHVGEIKNLSVEEDGKSRPISNGEELASCTAYGVDVLVQELTVEVLSDRLTEAEKKSTPPLSSLSTKDGPGKSGTPPTTESGNNSALDTSSGANSKTT
jgi:hypothetical protein